MGKGKNVIPLYFASFEHVFTGQERMVLFRAPSHALAEAIAEESRGRGELLQDLNFASFFEGVSVELVDLTWEPKKVRAGTKGRHRTFAVRRNKG